MTLGSIQRALVDCGLAKAPKQRKRKPKTFQCRKCGQAMYQPEDTNVMACTNPKCDNYYIFDR